MPQYNFTNLRELLEKSGITVAEAAKIFKISRPTAYSWCEGHTPTQGLLLSNSTRLIAVIERALNSGALPLKDVDKDARMGLLTVVLRQHLNGG